MSNLGPQFIDAHKDPDNWEPTAFPNYRDYRVEGRWDLPRNEVEPPELDDGTVEVPMERILSAQPDVNPRAVQALMDIPQDEWETRPMLTHIEGVRPDADPPQIENFYRIVQGNHRANAALRRGDPSLRAHVEY